MERANGTGQTRISKKITSVAMEIANTVLIGQSTSIVVTSGKEKWYEGTE